jgi:DNA mismatch repair protein MutL
MDIIHLLPDSVANQIAAGEVVQRPASVIKELMENAVDAGASTVDVLVVDAGRTSIQVIDDGKGMSEQDARMAFERHATSKIKQAEDLYSLHTMGFRGEALPSIAAVAQVHLLTRTIDNELGTDLTIEGSQITSQEACSCPVGANFEVRNLFFNVPARRKFLKSNQTELNNIIQEFERIALVNPTVSFSFSHNGEVMTKLPASNLRQRIVNVFGKKLNEQLLSVDVDTTLARITGFVGKPETARKKNANQFFFVNGRYMRHPYFHKAVLEAYAHLIPEGEQIPYFLYFEVDPANIDVNIHPTKTEIKFENDSAIWQILVAAIKDSLGKFNAVPTIDFDVEGRPDIPAFDFHAGADVHAPRVQVDNNYNPFRSSEGKSQSQRQTPVDWEQLYANIQKSTPDADYQIEEPAEQMQDLFSDEAPSGMEMSNCHFQYRGQYILTPVQTGLMMVDQHRAHVRILYERFYNQMHGQKASSQGLLFPEMLRLPPSDAILFQDMLDGLRSLGFDIESLGGGSFSVNGVPTDLKGANPVSVLTQMVETVKEKETGIENELQHRIALVMARNTSIVAGQVLSNTEMESLLAELFQCQNPNLTPTGKVIVSVLEQTQIDKLFGR